jgi:hypothetical protein
MFRIDMGAILDESTASTITLSFFSLQGTDNSK